MARSTHGYCTLHLIGYNRELDRTCPQCINAHIQPAKQLDFDSQSQRPVDASGKPVEAADVAGQA